MADLYAATKAYLKADAALVTAVGSAAQIKDDDDVGPEGLKIEDLYGSTPRVSNTIYLNWSTQTPISRGPQLAFGASSGEQGVSVFLEVYFYQNKGYAAIEAMRKRVTKLLHQQRVSIDTDYLYNFIWRGDLLRQSDQALGGARMERTRFEGVYLRRF